MESLSVFDLLVMHDLVADLPARWLHRLAGAGCSVRAPAGQRLIREDADADRFWLVHRGTVGLDFHVPGHGDIFFGQARAGSLVGWSWLRPPYRWTCGAVVTEDIHAVEFEADAVRRLMAEDPALAHSLGLRVLDVVAERLVEARHRLVEWYAFPG
ncbi:Crp/Fnr family transcriptional regulator [Actinoplanes sp. NPDC020271]|uniref:Crp/Fnr family transcriptional regulator n=1 Tax=Actinoplanes sp. NPDC020271 TaxID=3363896 RepID=UPI0037AFFB84